MEELKKTTMKEDGEGLVPSLGGNSVSLAG